MHSSITDLLDILDDGVVVARACHYLRLWYEVYDDQKSAFKAVRGAVEASLPKDTTERIKTGKETLEDEELAKACVAEQHEFHRGVLIDSLTWPQYACRVASSQRL